MSPAEFKYARHALGYTLRGMAMRVGVTPRNIRRWELGQREVSGPAARLVHLLLWMRDQGVSDPYHSPK